MSYRYNDNSRTDELVKKMIPVLVRWAQASWDSPHYYSDLQKAIGATSPRLGHQLGCLSDVMEDVANKLDYPIPTLNALVINKGDQLPSEGFDYVDKSYSALSLDGKRAYAKAKNKEAHDFDWTPVLNYLGLKPSTIITPTEVDSIRKNISHSGKGGGEGVAHKQLKEKVASNPKSIGISEEANVETEHCLLSGDRLDVYFETPTTIYGIEVKSHISSEDDIIRGIFQCVKYQAVLEKEQIFSKKSKAIQTILVIENTLTQRCQQIVSDLGINVIENYQTVNR